MSEIVSYTIKTSVALFTALLSMWVILAGMSTQAVLAMTSNLLPGIVAWPIGFFMTTPLCFLCIPALLSAVAGVFGLPFSLPLLIYRAILALWPRDEPHKPSRSPIGDFITFAKGAFGTLWKYFIPPLFIQASNESSPWLVWLLLREPCKYYPPLASQTKKGENPFPDEKWIYINGVATTKDIADANRIMLYEMFGRPIHLVHNPSDTILFDLIECIMGKTGLLEFGEVEPREVLKAQLRKSLAEAKQNGVKKVVLLAHSQGTIITSNAISELGEEGGGDIRALMKEMLEVYNFANCAHQTPAENVSYLENISNGGDVVAWLGHLFPKILQPYWLDKSGDPITISGEDVVEPSLWGHLLNSHYLFPMNRSGKYRKSKLVTKYLNGKGKMVKSVSGEIKAVK